MLSLKLLYTLAYNIASLGVTSLIHLYVYYKYNIHKTGVS
jgi:hypothetical protein